MALEALFHGEVPLTLNVGVRSPFSSVKGSGVKWMALAISKPLSCKSGTDKDDTLVLQTAQGTAPTAPMERTKVFWILSVA